MENNGTAKAISALSYVGIFWVLGLFVEKDHPDVKFHTNQGLVLFILEVMCGGVSFVLRVLPFVGWLLSGLVSTVLGLLCTAFMILGIINAVQGQRKPLPLIGSLQIIK